MPMVIGNSHNFHQHQLRAGSSNLILAKVTRFMVYYYYIMVFKYCSGCITRSTFDPPSGSVLPGSERDVNFTTLSCAISSGDMNRAVIWSVKFNDQEMLPITNTDEPFLIHGSLQNNLTVTNLTSSLDGAMLYCGTEKEPQLANFTLRIYREHQCTNV